MAVIKERYNIILWQNLSFKTPFFGVAGLGQCLLEGALGFSMGSSVVFVHRIGIHHFAHLRAVAESLDLVECAWRYLGIDHGHQALAAHRQTVNVVRAVARRRGESAWRLIGLSITVPVADASVLPSLDEFVDARNLDGWSEAEVGSSPRSWGTPPIPSIPIHSLLKGNG